MGQGIYSYEAHQRITTSRSSQSTEQVFTQRGIHPLMDPFGVKFRESRDSADHPNSLPIIFALDVTGSMGVIPDYLARKELPHFMQALLDVDIADPQILFMAIGDIVCDRAPLQVGQFESTAEAMDNWLTLTWLEGGGGGNGCESYDLAMYFAARHTLHDQAVKRGKRGYFFMTGDENCYPGLSRSTIKNIIGDELEHDFALKHVVEELSRVYHPFFLIPDKGRREGCFDNWTKVFGDHVIQLEHHQDTCLVAAALVSLCEGKTKKEVTAFLRANVVDQQRVERVLMSISNFAASFDPPVMDRIMP